MGFHYSAERNIQILIGVMKHHGIKKIIVSPGTQNISFVGSIQNDDYFEVFSAPDERSAAYIACGMAAESKETVAISCTGATASRNYIPGLTEAFYRKLPVLAITSSKHHAYVAQNYPQVIDRSQIQKDIAKKSVCIPIINSEEDEWDTVVLLNEAILELNHNGTGPVHINIETVGSTDFSVAQLPFTRIIDRIQYNQEMPEIPRNRKIAVFVGAHEPFDAALTNSIERFCEQNNAVVLCDHTSNYYGRYKINPALVTYQSSYNPKCKDVDLLIYIGNISGAYFKIKPKETWRVSTDGLIRDPYRTTRYVFEMEERDFFIQYNNSEKKLLDYYYEWEKEDRDIRSKMPDFPFSNIWICKEIIGRLQDNDCVHLGILNSLRSLNFFIIPKKITCFANTGGFGIDGPISTVLGGALARPEITHYLIVGDLAFFYDMNALGNRHFPGNVRILLINNGVGTEFKNYSHIASKIGIDSDKYIAAKGHYGNKSKMLVRHYAEDLGFKYITAENKEEFVNNLSVFTSCDRSKSIIFEIFTDSKEESDALKKMNTIKHSVDSSTKSIVKNIVGVQNINRLKTMIRK